ncbi:hypothetical protein GP486_008797, partial [Trichoglossum hirsutum]
RERPEESPDPSLEHSTVKISQEKSKLGNSRYPDGHQPRHARGSPVPAAAPTTPQAVPPPGPDLATPSSDHARTGKQSPRQSQTALLSGLADLQTDLQEMTSLAILNRHSEERMGVGPRTRRLGNRIEALVCKIGHLKDRIARLKETVEELVGYQLGP